MEIYAAWDAFGPEMSAPLKLDVATSPVTLPFLPAQQGNLFLRLQAHVGTPLLHLAQQIRRRRRRDQRVASAGEPR